MRQKVIGMENFRRHQIQIVIIILSIFLFGTLGYYFIEDGWSLFDAFYMVAITITTVGYGETHDLSNAGRMFTTLLIFIGLGAAGTFATHIARFVIEGELKGMFGRKKMQGKIKKIKDHYIVCGHGKAVDTICLKLYESEIPFVVIDSESEPLTNAEQRGYLVINGNAANDMTLLSAGIERASGIVICIPDDASTLFISLAAREMNPQIHIIAQGSDPSIESRIMRAGADTVVYPLKLGGEQIARLIAEHCGISHETEIQGANPSVMGYYLRIFRHFGDDEITIDDAIAKTNARRAVALIREDGAVTDDPALTININQNDSVVMLIQKGKTAPDTKAVQRPKKVTWSDKLSLGITSIDGEHRTLVLLTGEFQEALSGEQSRENIQTLFDKLLDYTVQHFKNEEEIMRRYQYPDLSRHIQEHRALTQKVMELNKDKKYVFPENIADFLYSWLKDHIMGIDVELGHFLKEQGIR